jgi:chitinase
MPFTITLSEPVTTKVSVHFATMDGTAIQKIDYSAKHGTVSFSPGQTSKVVNVTIRRDAVPDTDETFLLELSLPKNASIADGEAVGTILDHGPVGLSISDASLQAPISRSKSMTFTISLTKATTHTVKVTYQTLDLTAHAGVDYTAKKATVSISAGKTSVPINITIKPDTTSGPAKIFIVQLSLPSGALIVDGLGAGTIILS